MHIYIYIYLAAKKTLRAFFFHFFGSLKRVKTIWKRTEKTIKKRSRASLSVKKRLENGSICKKNDSKTVPSGGPVCRSFPAHRSTICPTVRSTTQSTARPSDRPIVHPSVFLRVPFTSDSTSFFLNCASAKVSMLLCLLATSVREAVATKQG